MASPKNNRPKAGSKRQAKRNSTKSKANLKASKQAIAKLKADLKSAEQVIAKLIRDFKRASQVLAKLKAALSASKPRSSATVGELSLAGLGDGQTVEVYHSDGTDGPEPNGYTLLPGDELVASTIPFDLNDGGSAVVRVAPGAAANDPATVDVEDAGFFDSIEEHYDDAGDPIHAFNMEDGSISIRG